MNIQIDTTLMEVNPEPTEIEVDAAYFALEFQNSDQSSISVGGISFSALPVLRRAVIATNMAVMNMIPHRAVDQAELQHIHFVFPTAPNYVDDDYSRIREEIIASGLPMLSDEDLRREIRERKGGDAEN